MSLESFDQTEERAKRDINERLDPNFEEKYEIVKPALEKYENAEKAKKIEQREKEDKSKHDSVRGNLIQEMKETKTEPVNTNTIGIEQTMFTPAKMKERAENRIMMMRSGKNPEAVGQPWSEKAEEVLKQSGIEKRFVSSDQEKSEPTSVGNSEVQESERSPQQKRADNVLSMIEKGKLNTPEKRGQNRSNLFKQIEARGLERQERKSRAQKLAAWWKRLNGNS